MKLGRDYVQQFFLGWQDYCCDKIEDYLFGIFDV